MTDRFLPPEGASGSPGGVPERAAPGRNGVEPHGRGAPPPPASSPQEADPQNWLRHLEAIGRHKWIVVLGLCAGVGAGIFLQRNLSPTYQTESTLWIEQGEAGGGEAGPIRPGRFLSASGWIDLIRSNAVMEPVVDSLRLHVRLDDPAHEPLFADFDVSEDVRSGRYAVRIAGGRATLLDAEGEELERAEPGSPLGESRGMRWIVPEEAARMVEEIGFRVTRPREMARSLADRLDLRIDPEGTFLRVGLQGSDPEYLARVVNGVANQYVGVAGDLKRARLDELTGTLEDQLAYAEQNLLEAELALEDFRVSTVTQPGDGGTGGNGGGATGNPVFQRYQELRVEDDELRRDEVAIERALERSSDEGRLATETLELIPSVQGYSDLAGALTLVSQKRTELRALRLGYTDEHESVREVLAELRELEESAVPELAGHLLEELAERRRSIAASMGQTSGELETIPTTAVQATRLERRFASAEGLFVDLQGRYESARLGAESTIPDVWVLDRAPVPESPSSTPGYRVLAAGALAGLFLGLLGAVLRDARDRKLRTPEQVTAGLGLPILSVVPDVRIEDGRPNEEDHQQAVEAFRNLRLTTTFAQGGKEGFALTITSPGPGDGKSFTAKNLALAFAEAGRRTLVIDGDVRRGVLHERFGMDRRPGLTDYLAGDAELGAILRRTELGDLFLIPSGSLFDDAPELLNLPAMKELLEELRPRFDVILIDSAPMGGAVDPYLLGTLSGSMVVVLRDGSTDRQLAAARLGALDRLPVYVLGAVLNGVSTQEGPYAYYAYAPGYGSEGRGRAGGRRALEAGTSVAGTGEGSR